MYASFLLEIFFNFPLDPQMSYLSEYFSLDSPYRLVFATSDLLAATLSLAGLICLSDFYRSWSRLQQLIALFFVIFSIATVFDVTFPLRCAESLDFCEKTGLTAHLIASAVVSGSLTVIALSTLALIYVGHITERYRIFLSVIVICYVVLTAIIAVIDFTAYPVGYLQRGQVFFSCLLLASAGLVLTPYANSDTRISSRS
ncbi:DUF998 domain-containing protein [Arcanobacterium buesumense]|uniref:DUF998 domain-containing protein n=1 Tax=Arcanobacterium buesumense TaxID=2722751 RepID=A0A6H2ELH2_9ACTO|nr:DUF998 domain-containing protein [Arcanobacterium buesumense]QJC21912.1 DUF998 domain-containing protein [Arcanobacterium buesumense]